MNSKALERSYACAYEGSDGNRDAKELSGGGDGDGGGCGDGGGEGM